MAGRVWRRGDGTLPRWVSLGLLGVLAVVTLIVTVLAMGQLRTDNPNAGRVPQASVKTAPASEPTPEPEPVPEPVQSPTMQRLLAVSAQEAHLLRSQVGACPDPVAVLEYSEDGGESWRAGSLVNAGATRLLQLNGDSPDTDRFVAQDAACAVLHARSFVSGADWEPEEAGDAWYLDPGDVTAAATVVHTPSGVQTLPCQAVGLASQASRAAVLCLDSAVTVSADAGASWSAPVAVPYGSAVGVTPSIFLVASFGEAAGSAECAGVRVRGFDGASLGEAGACVDAADAAGGNLALAGDDSVIYLWAGSVFLRSNDLGKSWG